MTGVRGREGEGFASALVKGDLIGAPVLGVRVVLNDGKLDTGNIAPGRYSASMILATPGPYHCSIHPEMIGTITGDQ